MAETQTSDTRSVHPLFVRTADDWTPAPSARQQDFIRNDTSAIRLAVEAIPSLRICRLAAGSYACEVDDAARFFVVSEPRVQDEQAQVLVVDVEIRGGMTHTVEYLVDLKVSGSHWEADTMRAVGGI